MVRRPPRSTCTNPLSPIPPLFRPSPDGEGDIPADVALPDTDSARTIIVIPEIFGVNAGIRKKCDDWAALGYLAIAPDIFWRFAPGIELDPDVEAEMNEAQIGRAHV